MTREEAYYMRLKILCGYTEDYNNLLDRHRQAENPLSDIVLSLTDCRDNAKEIESRLNSFCLEKPFDEESVYSKFRTELSEQYEKNTISTEEVVYILNTLSQKLPVCSFQNHCNMLSDCY